MNSNLYFYKHYGHKHDLNMLENIFIHYVTSVVEVKRKGTSGRQLLKQGLDWDWDYRTWKWTENFCVAFANSISTSYLALYSY